MNNYPSWWDTTITLYNKFINPETKKVSWYRHVISDCFYKHTVDKITMNNTTIESNSSICRIRINDAYVNKNVWNDLQAIDKKTYFTLCTGDIIVAGEVEFEIDDYKQGQYSSELLKQYKDYPGCFTIESVNINTGGGRGNEHYHVRGT